MISYKIKRAADVVKQELDNELQRIKDEDPDEYYRLLSLLLQMKKEPDYD